MNTVHRFVRVKLGPGHPDVDDVVQETLIGAVGAAGRLRGSSKATVSAWLLSIARHKIADHLRMGYRDRGRRDDLSPNVTDPATTVDETIAHKDRAERVRKALGLLTPEQEEVLILRFILGFDINEVAEMTMRPAGAVKSMQHRALASLQQKLAGEEEAWR